MDLKQVASSVDRWAGLSVVAMAVNSAARLAVRSAAYLVAHLEKH